MTLVRAEIKMVGSQKCIMETGNTSIPSDSEISNILSFPIVGKNVAQRQQKSKKLIVTTKFQATGPWRGNPAWKDAKRQVRTIGCLVLCYILLVFRRQGTFVIAMF